MPLHDVLWDYLALLEGMDVEQLRTDRDALRLASLINIALGAPQKLVDEERRLAQRARAIDAGRAGARESAAAVRAKGEAMVRRMAERGVFAEAVS